MDARTLRNITAKTAHTPRFLLRTYDSRSGGDANLNKPTYCIPRAFGRRHPIPSRNIADHTVESLRTNVASHTGFRENFDTFFSSWSQDLEHIQGYVDCEDESAHLAIIDTKAISNVVVHSIELAEILGHSSYGTWEFLAFGPMTGSGYTAVKIKDLLDLGYRDFFTGRRYWREMVDHAISIGVPFGPKFEVAIAAYLLAQLCPFEMKELKEAARAMGKIDVPKEWTTDVTLNGGKIAAFGSPGCMKAYWILQYIIEINSQPEEESSDRDAEGETDDEVSQEQTQEAVSGRSR